MFENVINYNPNERDYRFWLVVDPRKWILPSLFAVAVVALVIHVQFFQMWDTGPFGPELTPVVEEVAPAPAAEEAAPAAEEAAPAAEEAAPAAEEAAPAAEEAAPAAEEAAPAEAAAQ